MLWHDERMTGVPLLDAVEREVLTDTSSVRGITPIRRRRIEHMEDLERDESRMDTHFHHRHMGSGKVLSVKLMLDLSIMICKRNTGMQ